MHQRNRYECISIDKQLFHLKLRFFVLVDFIADKLQKKLGIFFWGKLRQSLHILLSSLLHIGWNIKLIVLGYLQSSFLQYLGYFGVIGVFLELIIFQASIRFNLSGHKQELNSQ